MNKFSLKFYKKENINILYLLKKVKYHQISITCSPSFNNYCTKLQTNMRSAQNQNISCTQKSML